MTLVSKTGWDSTNVDLSIVLPCFKSDKLAARSSRIIADALRDSGLRWEIIVVNDGGPFDATLLLSAADDRVRLYSLDRNMGKGAAIRHGIEQANGDVVIFTDVDLPYGTAHFEPIYQLIANSGFHIVIGDRLLPGSSYALELSPQRRLASGIFTAIVAQFIKCGFVDTQCGLKALRRDVGSEVCRISSINRFAFDVELLYISLLHKLDIKRIPVRLQSNETSSVRIFRDSLIMLGDLVRIRLNSKFERYRSIYLSELVTTEYNERLSATPRLGATLKGR